MQFWSLKGQLSYKKVWDFQKKLVSARADDLIPDTVLFLEHSPVVTRGSGLQKKTGQTQSLQRMPDPILPKEIEFSETDRGGDLTYHGPGQLVVYPIIKLDGNGFGPKHDLAAYLRKLEEVFILELADWGLCGRREEGATGVWIDEKKVMSIGIAVRKWVSFHGMAINVVNDLKPFRFFQPCGFNPEVMAKLENYPGFLNALQENQMDWRAYLEKRLVHRFSSVGAFSAANLENQLTYKSVFDIEHALQT